MHQGLFDKSGQPKFAWAGPVPDPEGWEIRHCGCGRHPASVPILGMACATMALAMLLALAGHIDGVFAATVFHYG